VSKIGGKHYDWREVTAADFILNAKLAACLLVRKKFKPGAKVLIIAHSSYWVLLMEFACLYAGLTVVPIYETASKRQVKSVVDQVNPCCGFIDSVRYESLLPKDLEVIGVQELVESTHGTRVNEKKLAERRPSNTDVAAMVWTAGMDGKRVGIEYTHEDFLKNVDTVSARLKGSGLNVDRYLSFLSFAHISPRIFLYAAISLGARVGVSPGVRHLLKDLADFKPTFIVSVPRVFDSLYAQILDSAPNHLLSLLIKWQIHRVTIGKTSPRLTRKVKQMFGGCLEGVFSSAIKADSRLLQTFTDFGVPAFDCYTSTEFKGVISMNVPKQNKIGTVGVPLEQFQVAVEDGEILIDGAKTGDLGAIDSDGFLSINGREKDVIILRNGRSVLPEPLQQALATDPMIEDVLVIGENRPYLAALISLNNQHKRKVLDDCGLDEDSIEGAVLIDRLVEKAIEKLNRLNSKDESILKYVILEDGFAKKDEFMTGSLLLKRDAVCKFYKQLINEVLY
jgi:long-chain acyl-CoA synthetase